MTVNDEWAFGEDKAEDMVQKISVIIETTFNISDLIPTAVIDEFSIMFPHEEVLASFLTSMIDRAGWEHFNTATDHVDTQPIPSCYTVQYEFLRHPDVPWRIEAMMVTGGFSPLHGRLLTRMAERRTDCAPTHLSFKCPSAADYIDAIDILSQGPGSPWTPVQFCEAKDYGSFSYWLNDSVEESAAAIGEKGPVLALKPRWNRNDG